MLIFVGKKVHLESLAYEHQRIQMEKFRDGFNSWANCTISRGKAKKADALSRSVQPSGIMCKHCEMLWNYVNENEQVNMKVEKIAVVIDEPNIENNQEECAGKVKLSIQKWIPSPGLFHLVQKCKSVKKRRWINRHQHVKNISVNGSSWKYRMVWKEQGVGEFVSQSIV